MSQQKIDPKLRHQEHLLGVLMQVIGEINKAHNMSHDLSQRTLLSNAVAHVQDARYLIKHPEY